MSQGWVKIHRKLLDSDIWHDPITFRLFVYLIMKATHSRTVINGIELKEGQYIRSYRKLAQDLSYRYGRGMKEHSVKTIKKCIAKLIDSERVLVEEREWGTLFTILNYALYQESNDKEKEIRNEWETNGEQMGNKSNNAKNAKNAEENNNPSRSKLNFETHHMKLAELLFKKIMENNPSAKEPNLESWANTFRLMMERPNEKRSGKDIQDLIIWSQSHHFWYKNILSADKLRKQFDRLLMEMKEDNKFEFIKGGGHNEESSYSNDYSKYDFSKRRNLRGLSE